MSVCACARERECVCEREYPTRILASPRAQDKRWILRTLALPSRVRLPLRKKLSWSPGRALVRVSTLPYLGGKMNYVVCVTPDIHDAHMYVQIRI